MKVPAALVRAHAIYTHSQGAPIRDQQRLYEKLERARDRYPAVDQDVLEAASREWWGSRAMRGAGVDY